MISKLRTLAVIAAATASIATISTTAQARDVYVRVAPPPPRTVVVPAARPGYVWAPGYWNWRGNRHVWANGHWVRARRGYVYRQPTWVQDGDRWRFRQGAWGRGDNDRDGIPNRLDNHPNNPLRP